MARRRTRLKTRLTLCLALDRAARTAEEERTRTKTKSVNLFSKMMAKVSLPACAVARSSPGELTPVDMNRVRASGQDAW